MVGAIVVWLVFGIIILGILELDRSSEVTNKRELTIPYQEVDYSNAAIILRAIADLHELYNKGAMCKGNYNSALWGLLDKLDRKI